MTAATFRQVTPQQGSEDEGLEFEAFHGEVLAPVATTPYLPGSAGSSAFDPATKRQHGQPD